MEETHFPFEKVKELKVTPELTHREESNSAIGSWSGYIYQGLCGILVVLRMINEDRGKYHDYSMQLDADEDFTIYDGTNKIYSLHQCKSIKGVTDYEKEFKKIAGKVEAKKDMLLDPDNPLYYFHSNCEVVIDKKYGITPYPFTEKETYCTPGAIQQLLNEEIKKIKTVESDTDSVRAALETLVNGEILNIQQKYFDAKPGERLYKIARAQRLPFSRFEEIIGATILKFNKGDFLNQMKSAYIIELDNMSTEESEGTPVAVNAFIDMLNSMGETELMTFLQRINPKDKLVESHECWHDITSKERIHWLYNLITEIPLDKEGLHWKTAKGLQTPSTLGNDEKIERLCAKIDANQANLDFPWIYDWIVGHVDEHVDDISSKARIITKTPEDDVKPSIFRTKKVGILTKKEKKDGIYD